MLLKIWSYLLIFISYSMNVLVNFSVNFSPRNKREYLVNILIMPKRRFHFHSVVAARLQDHPVACPQLRKESESDARALLKW